jgi:signal transduction histidine kinase
MLDCAGNRNTDCQLRLVDRQVTVSVDAARFEAAVLNLVVNAVDAMPNGGMTTISTEIVESKTE